MLAAVSTLAVASRSPSDLQVVPRALRAGDRKRGRNSGLFLSAVRAQTGRCLGGVMGGSDRAG